MSKLFTSLPPSPSAGPAATLPYDVAVVGGGPAGLAAALEAALNGAAVTLLEGEATVGKKLLLTGGGRCNFSRTGTVADFVQGFHENGPFLYSALTRFDNQHYCNFLQAEKVSITADASGRLLTQLGRASLVRDAFLKAFKRAGGSVFYHSKVLELTAPAPSPDGDSARFKLKTDRHSFSSLAVVLAGGAPCYPQTGSDGSLLPLAARLGLKLAPLSPALCAIPVELKNVSSLAGISLADAQLTVKRGKKKLAQERGSLLFTHQGISGPIALNLARRLSDRNLNLELNLLPDETAGSCSEKIDQAGQNNKKLNLRNYLRRSFPLALSYFVLEKLNLDPARPLAQTARPDREALAQHLTQFSLPYAKLPPLAKGMTCRGGLELKEFDPRSLMARRCPGLFACGDILDLDGKSGGYNLQAAYSTGRLAGLEAARFCQDSR